MNNLSSYSGLVDARISAFDKYLPVNTTFLSKRQFFFSNKQSKIENSGFVKTCDEYVHKPSAHSIKGIGQGYRDRSY